MPKCSSATAAPVVDVQGDNRWMDMVSECSRFRPSADVAQRRWESNHQEYLLESYYGQILHYVYWFESNWNGYVRPHEHCPSSLSTLFCPLMLVNLFGLAVYFGWRIKYS